MDKIKLVLGASFLLLVSGQVNAAPVYSVTNIGNLGFTNSSGYSITTATAINSSGQITGSSTSSSGGQHAFFYDGFTMHDLGTLSGPPDSVGLGINDDGKIVGASGGKAFLYDGTVMRDIGGLGGYALARDINNNGQVTGRSYLHPNAEPGTGRAFLYDGTTMKNLGTLGSDVGSVGYAINSSGQVAGYSKDNIGSSVGDAFLYDGTTMKDISNPVEPSSEQIAFGINDAGIVVGRDSSRGFLYDGTSMNDLGEILAQDINNLGQVVGWGANPEGAGRRVIKSWDSINGILNLHNFIDSDDPLFGQLMLDTALGINDNGQIIAFGGERGKQGTHSYLLSPIPGLSLPPDYVPVFPDVNLRPCETSTITCLHIPEISNLDADDVEAYTGTKSQLTLLYKSDFDAAALFGAGEESGLYKDNYSTEYDTDEDGEPTGADIFHDLGDIINCAECYLVVKDGRQGDPAQYLFDISDSGDLMTMALNGFWDGEGVKGSISNIAIYGATQSPVPVPAAIWLFGTALIGFVGMSRRRKVS